MTADDGEYDSVQGCFDGIVKVMHVVLTVHLSADLTTELTTS